MTREPLDELYFRWLYSQVAPMRLKNPSRTYWTLFAQLHDKEFRWFVPNDDNRAEDGKVLRYEFLNGRPPREQLGHHGWVEARPCSMLEMLIALSRRLSFAGGGASETWFWHLMDNLGLRGYTDARPGSPAHIDHVLNRVIERTYSRSGRGGLFPLDTARQDQRDVELWYQMSQYLMERG